MTGSDREEISPTVAKMAYRKVASVKKTSHPAMSFTLVIELPLPVLIYCTALTIANSTGKSSQRRTSVTIRLLRTLTPFTHGVRRVSKLG